MKIQPSFDLKGVHTFDFSDIRTGDVIFKNVCERRNIEILYTKTNDRSTQLRTSHGQTLKWNLLDTFQLILKDVFLPKGYPHSVSSDYLEYQLWDTCQAFCSSISGTLSMSAIMEGVGVGSQTATPVSAAITWIMKDGTGMVGSIIFTWLKGSKLDSDCKRWRLFADALNDAAMCIELCIPLVMQYSVYLLSLSTVMKALVGVAGSATRAALTCHQAIQGNMADVSAKDGSQEIFVHLCAYLFGIFLLQNINESNKTWAVMCTFIVLHLFSNYKAVSCLKINVYNGERYRLSLRSFLTTSSVPTVEQVNRNESVFLGGGSCDRVIFGFDIRLGVSMQNAVLRQKLTADDVSFLVYLFQSRNYLIMPNVKKGEILITFRRDSVDIDVMKAYFHAVLTAVAIELTTRKRLLPIIKRRRNNSTVSRLEKVLKEYDKTKKSDFYRSRSLPVAALLSCDEVVDREFALFCKLSLEQCWNFEKCLILVEDWRADWKFAEDKNSNFPSDIKNLKKNNIPTRAYSSIPTRTNSVKQGFQKIGVR